MSLRVDWLGGQWRHIVTASLLVTVVGLYFLELPIGWSDQTPLPWDCSSHYLGALRIRQALLDTDLLAVHSETFGADLYPPGHSLVLGFWFALVGTNIQVWLLFGLVAYVLTVLLARAISPVGAAIIVSLVFVGALAPSLMVEPVAVLFLTASFWMFHRMAGLRRTRLRDGLLLATLMSATVLTKYNIGLPLVLALPAAALSARRRDLAVHTGIAAAMTVVLFMLFLTVQTHGWESFLRFAENRSNSAGMGPLDRLRWYFRVLDDVGTIWRPWTLTILGLCLLGLRGRKPAWVATTTYVVLSMVALAGHEYLLSRNLVGPAVGLSIAAGMGASSLPRPRLTTAFLLLLALTLSWNTLGPRRDQVDRYYPPQSAQLSALSGEVGQVLESAGRSQRRVLVMGMFNEFGPAWIRVLAQQHDAEAVVSFEPPFPLESDRTHRSSAWNPVYREIADEIAASKVDVVVAVELDSTSVFHGEDYRNWGAWKINLVRALRENSSFEAVRAEHFPPGVGLTVFERGVADSLASGLAFLHGWGPRESWGRWAEEKSATLRIPPSSHSRILSYEVALSAELYEGQSWTVAVNGTHRSRHDLHRPIWEFHTHDLLLPPSQTSLTIAFEFPTVAARPSGRPLALAFRGLKVRDVLVY